MFYVQYFDTNLNGEVDEALGDRAIVILDGRNSLDTMEEDAVFNNGNCRPEYKAYQIRKGGQNSPFTNYRNLTALTSLT